MIKYIVFNSAGKILRTGTCMDQDFLLQAENGETVIEGTANDIIHKIVNGGVVDKTAEEIESEKPIRPDPVPFDDQNAKITNKEWQNILSRLEKLEK